MLGNPFALLGLPERFELTLPEIEKAVRDVRRNDANRLAVSAAARRQQLGQAVDVNAAFRIVKDEVARGEALLALRGRMLAVVRDDPDFLLEVMELREALAEARQSRALPRLLDLRARVERDLAATRSAIAQAFQDDQLERAEEGLGRMRYYRRFCDELDLAEDSLH